MTASIPCRELDAGEADSVFLRDELKERNSRGRLVGTARKPRGPFPAAAHRRH